MPNSDSLQRQISKAEQELDEISVRLETQKAIAAQKKTEDIAAVMQTSGQAGLDSNLSEIIANIRNASYGVDPIEIEYQAKLSELNSLKSQLITISNTETFSNNSALKLTDDNTSISKLSQKLEDDLDECEVELEECIEYKDIYEEEATTCEFDKNQCSRFLDDCHNSYWPIFFFGFSCCLILGLITLWIIKIMKRRKKKAISSRQS